MIGIGIDISIGGELEEAVAPGDALTVDDTDITVDDTDITADQTVN